MVSHGGLDSRASHPGYRSLLALTLGLGLTCAGCGDDDTADSAGADDGGVADANTTGDAAAAAPTNPAVLLVGQSYGFDETYLTYAGVFPEVPEGEVDFENFREFGNANVYTNGGYVFVEEDGRVTRFSVNEELELVDGPSFSWQDFGIAEINASYTVFVSERRAYTFAPDLGVIVIWDPETMERTGALEFDLPERSDGMSTFAYDGYLLGDKVVWNMFSGDWDTSTAHPAITLAIADAHSDDEPVRFVEDDRCLPGGPSFVDERGDYYVHGGAFFGYFFVYGDPDARTCILRVKAGQDAFDPDYLVDYEELTGSYVNEPWIHVSGSQYVTRGWDPDVAFPEDPDQFYGNEALRSLLVDPTAGTAEPYPDLDELQSIDGATREVDGISYYQVSETGYVPNGDTDVVELHPDGIRHKFHVNGFLLGLERIR